jgi:hypothetical protein
MSRTYERLDVVDFGRALIQCGDLDPLYIALNRSQLELSAVKRFLVGYWCTYHVGQSAWLAEKEGQKFFNALNVVAANTTPAPVGGRWPRGKERRHWRGEQATKSALELNARYKHAEEMVDFIAGWEPHRDYAGEPMEVGQFRDPIPFAEVNRRVQEHRGFGDWIAFKVGDMLETCLGVPVSFDEAEVFMFKDPAKAASMVFRAKNPELAAQLEAGAFFIRQEEINKRVSGWLERQFIDLAAPHNGKRPVRLQEVETVLCKWKSHMNGHYPVGNDITEIREGLAPWAQVSDFAAELLRCMPEEVK